MPSLFQPWRRRVHLLLLALFAGLPFLRIGGESALRFDVPTLRLHFFGSLIRMDEFFLLLLLTLSLAFFLIWTTVVYGRIWCGWLCPQAVLVNLTEREGSDKKSSVLAAISAQVRIAAVSILAGAVTVWYVVPPPDFFRDLAAGSPGPVILWSWIVLAALIWLNLLLVRYSFCATVCPYSRLQGVIFDRHTLVIAFDANRREECVECSACVKACPVGVDIRDGLQAACVNCTECIDTCARVMNRKKRKSLIGFFFGGAGGAARIRRPVSVITLVLSLSFLLFFMIALGGRSVLEATLLPRAVPPRLSASGRLVSSFELSVENRDRGPLALRLRGEGGGDISLSPRQIALDAGEHRRLSLTISSAGPGSADIIIEGADGPLRRLPVKIMLPDEK